MEIAGQTINGAQNIFFAQLADPNTTKFSVDATRFMAGKFPFMMFGLPGAALAMYRCARNEKKKVVGGLLLSAALTAFLTGMLCIVCLPVSRLCLCIYSVSESV